MSKGKRIRLLNRKGEGTDHITDDTEVWYADLIKNRGRIFYFEGVNQYGDRVYRDVEDPDFRPDPEDTIAEIA